MIIACYSVERAESLKHVRDKWIPEIRRFCPTTPILVVGNKKDIREESSKKLSAYIQGDENTQPEVPLSEAQEFAKEVSHYPLIECSAKTRENVRYVFDTAIKAALGYRSRCSSKVLQSIMKLKLVF